MFASSTILFLNTNSGAIQALSIIILVLVTCYYAWQTRQQAKATKEQAEITKEIEKNQGVPAVEVYMIYDKNSEQNGGTYFKFFNFSNIPAFVSIRIYFTLKNGETYSHFVGNPHYRIGPGIKTWTSATFFEKDKNQFIHVNGTEARLSITVANTLSKNSDLKMTYEKDYKFCVDVKDVPTYRWNENTWGFVEIEPRDITTELQGISKELNEIKKISVRKNE